MDPKPTGLIGVGLLGSAIAERLLSTGTPLVGFDLEPSRVALLSRSGATPASSSAEVAARCQRILLSLPTSAIASQVVGEILTSAASRVAYIPTGGPSSPLLVIDTTTGSPEAAQELASRLNSIGGYYLDATIAGSSQQVRDREAIVMVGGDRSAFDQCHDLLDALGQQVFYLGPPGSGARMKLVVNLVLGLNRAVLAEGLALARRCGIDPAVALEVLRASPARSMVMETKGEKMIRGDFTPQARLAQHHKDVLLIQQLAHQYGATIPLTDVHRSLLERAAALGLGDADNSAVIRAYE